MATSFSDGGSGRTRREPPTMGKQLVSFMTCGCESRAPFCNLQSRVRTHAVLLIGLYVIYMEHLSKLQEQSNQYDL
jgi:hypothetical protein